MALLQVACRKNGWPLDRSTLSTTVTTYTDIDDVEKRPNQVRIYILQLLVIFFSPVSLVIETGC